jgi:PmbA protein
MIGKEKIVRLLKEVLAESKLTQAEAVFIGAEYGLTRYANSAIHQNMADQSNNISFKVVIDKKVGVASSNILEKEALKRACLNAAAVAERAKVNPNFGGLAGPAKYKKLTTHFDVTAKVTPAKRAAAVKKICDKALKKGLSASGALTTSESEIAIVNTKGLAAYQPSTSSFINIIYSSEDSSGYAQGLSRRFDKLDFAALSDKALEKCLLSRNPRTLEPGQYDVIVEPVAAANLLEWLAFIAFTANPYHEQTSFLSGKKGKKIAATALSIFDDGLDPSSIAFPFDFEGLPKKKVFFIRKGLGGGPVYDLSTARKFKTKSTGHGMTPGNSGGPMPLNIHIASGTKPFAKMLTSMERGILVTRFHYINGFLDTPKALLTGMTRDGTFLVEKGKIVSGIKNLRFTESMLRAFGNIEAISKESELVDTWWSDIGCIKAPALQIRNFNFSGKTEF